MLKVFQVCFYTGLFYTIISFLLGQIFEFAGGGGGDVDASVDFDVDVDVDMDVSGGADADAGGLSAAHVSPLKPIVIASFITVFGGVGIICVKKDISIMFAALIAFALAAAVSFSLYKFIVVPLYKAQNTSATSYKEMKGGLAKISLAIKGSSYGRISYVINGNTYSAPARSIDNTDIEKGANVVIINIEKNTFYVKKIKGGN